MVNMAPKDSNSVMRAQWPNLTYSAKVWDNSQAASEFGRGVLHLNLVKELYTLASEVLMAQVVKQIVLGHHYQMVLLDRVHNVSGLVTIIGHRTTNLEEEVKKLRSEDNPE
ncbi:hypothetical protein BHM03_00004643 [Ensete ventricosum]|nr:hypothetical protein BHM03_00004643 [Ensete ventricosum]